MNTEILWYSSRATGAVSLVLFTVTLVLGILTAARHGSAALPRAAVLRLHRSVSITAMAFLAIHIVTAIADCYVALNYWNVIVPFAAAWDPFWVGLGSAAGRCLTFQPASPDQPSDGAMDRGAATTRRWARGS